MTGPCYFPISAALRLQILICAGLPFSLLAMTEKTMQHMGKPELVTWVPRFGLLVGIHPNSINSIWSKIKSLSDRCHKKSESPKQNSITWVVLMIDVFQPKLEDLDCAELFAGVKSVAKGFQPETSSTWCDMGSSLAHWKPLHAVNPKRTPCLSYTCCEL